jgi:hypothetical protein
MNARKAAFAAHRGFVLRRVNSAEAHASLDAATAAFVGARPNGFPLATQAFYAAQLEEVSQWWSCELADLHPTMRADDECFESAAYIRDQMELHRLEGMELAGEFEAPHAAAMR